MRRTPTARAAVLAALAGLCLVTPATRGAAAPPMCRPSRPGHDGCIPSPLECATGRYNGVWKSPTDGRRATCDGYTDTAGRGHIRNYVGGDPSVGCGATIRDDTLIDGSWTDPNQMCGAYGIRPAINLAERGVRLTPFQIESLKLEKDRLNSYDEARRLYLDDGQVPAPYP